MKHNTHEFTPRKDKKILMTWATILSPTKRGYTTLLSVLGDDEDQVNDITLEIFTCARTKPAQVLKKLNKRYKIPIIPGDIVNQYVLLSEDEEYEPKDETDSTSGFKDAMDNTNVTQIVDVVDKILKIYDGSEEGLPAFLNQINFFIFYFNIFYFYHNNIYYFNITMIIYVYYIYIYIVFYLG